METAVYPNIHGATLFIQLPFDALSKNDTKDSMNALTTDIMRTTQDILHSHGAIAKEFKILVSERGIRLQMRIVAGSFDVEQTFYASRANHPVRTVTSKILRFLRERHSDLG